TSGLVTASPVYALSYGRETLSVAVLFSREAGYPDSSGHETLKRFADAHVLLVPALIEIQLLALYGFHARPRRHGVRTAALMLDQRSLQLVLRIVAPLPCQPVDGPLRMRGLELPLGERKRASAIPIQPGELLRK